MKHNEKMEEIYQYVLSFLYDNQVNQPALVFTTFDKIENDQCFFSDVVFFCFKEIPRSV